MTTEETTLDWSKYKVDWKHYCEEYGVVYWDNNILVRGDMTTESDQAAAEEWFNKTLEIEPNIELRNYEEIWQPKEAHPIQAHLAGQEYTKERIWREIMLRKKHNFGRGFALSDKQLKQIIFGGNSEIRKPPRPKKRS